MNYQTQAIEILSKFSNYRTVKQMVDAHNKSKRDTIKKMNSNYYWHGGEIEILIFDLDKKEPIGDSDCVKSISKKAVLECIVRALESGTKHFEICTDSHLYFHETLQDKFDGVEAEPADEYYGITIVKYCAE